MNKKGLILLTMLMSLSGCTIMTSSNSSTNSSKENSSIESSLINSDNTSNDLSSSSSVSSSEKEELKTFVIDCNNFNSISFIELNGVVVADEGYENIEFTFNSNGVMKSNKIQGIKEIEIHVYNTYENLKVYQDYQGKGNAVIAEVEKGNKEAYFTYTFNGNSEFYIKNTSANRTHVYSIKITYTGNVIDGGISSSSSSSNQESSSNNSSSDSSSSSESNNNSSSDSSSSNNSSSSTDMSEQQYTQGLTGREYLDYYGYVADCISFPSIGSPDMLVVPVMFKGESLSNSSKTLKDIEATFNGASEDTGWESVDSYYKKTSYGKLDMDIDVYDSWVTLDKTCSQLAALTSYSDPTWYAVNYVVDYLKNKGVDMTNYDSNKDGYIDGLWLVYGKNYSSATEDQKDLLWAYAYWMTKNSANVSSPVANVYAWASIEFMYEGGYSLPDAHTFIHETGHMLGLDDYYDYTEETTLAPAGCLDMMDYNIGDHNAYSKYLLGWIDPKYVSKSESITINSFESSGDSIVVPASLTDYKSPLNEYFIIEFYTPTGLNYKDSTENYSGNYPLLFSENGIKIYHVDSRIGELVYNGEWQYNDFVYNYKYNDLVSNTTNYSYYQIFTSNTPEYSYSDNYKLLTLLSSYKNSKKNYWYSNSYASNEDLYQEGDSIKSFTFNRGTSLQFEIYIDDVSSSSATIRFVKK